MKAKELMVGDWVRRTDDGGYYQVRQLGIFGTDRDGDDYPAVCVGKPKCIGLIVEMEEIEPIPLTPEILERNGFVYNDNPVVQAWEQFGLSIYGGGLINCGRNTTMKVSYVHQLQHALRLFGIEKEIEL